MPTRRLSIPVVCLVAAVLAWSTGCARGTDPNAPDDSGTSARDARNDSRLGGDVPVTGMDTPPGSDVLLPPADCGPACMCGPGQMYCGSACVDVTRDNSNCGGCGTVCRSPQSCAASACACPTGQTACGTSCVNTFTDAANCGSCGTTCAAGGFCNGGRCSTSCTAPNQLCVVGGMMNCANLQTDRENCGICGRACGVAQSCTSGSCGCSSGTTSCSGACVNTATDRNNCGACGRVCAGTSTCSGGVCGGSTDPCAAATGCAGCTSMGTCGWCNNVGGCHTGTSSGATDGACSGTNWAWISTSCTTADPCASSTGCSACSSRGTCGWCNNIGGCHTGTSSGATDGSCAGTNWAWISTQCRAPDPCASSLSCSACTAGATCGWCRSLGNCHTGTSTGATDGACSGTGWAWLSSQCP